MNIGQILLFVLVAIAFLVFLLGKVQISNTKIIEIMDWIKMLLIASWLGLASYIIMTPTLFT